MGLWNSFAGTLAVEVPMFIAGIWIYVAMSRARNAAGRFGPWALLLIISLSYAASLFSPPPPSVRALAIGGIIFGWLFVAWAAWADANRETRFGLERGTERG